MIVDDFTKYIGYGFYFDDPQVSRHPITRVQKNNVAGNKFTSVKTNTPAVSNAKISFIVNFAL